MSDSFYSKCKNTGGCVQWTGGMNFRKTCGIFNYKGLPTDVRRVSLALAGKDYKGGVVYSICGNNLCVNPEHTSIFSRKEWWSKNRSQFSNHAGEKNPNCKITEKDVEAIRLESLQGLSKTEIGKRYGISRSTVRLIVTKKIWNSHVA